MRLWPLSLQGQLAVRLAAVFFVVSLTGIGLLLWQGSEAADSFGVDMLRYRAAELARHIVRTPDGRARLNLPPELARLYNDQAGENLYAIRAGTNQVLASGKDASALVTDWQIERAPHNFRLEEFGRSQTDYYGLNLVEDSAVGPVAVSVAHSSDADTIAVAMLKLFSVRIAWMIPLFALVTLLIGSWSIRAGLRPVSAISRRAAQIDPGSAGVRLPAAGLPSELVPLVGAVNSALDRLQEGFAIQRRFTANAAHELRTPLTMLTAGLDELSDGPAIEKLRGDVARMNRLVGQLLRVARLDAIPAALNENVDIGRVAGEVVEYLAPWAIAQGRAIALEKPDAPALVTGNFEEMFDAVRNVVENAVLHTPPGTEVTVRASADGIITVDDEGPGISAEDRAHVFSRFWRGKGSTTQGAGLGLSIVAEIMRLHGGMVEVVTAPGGGASFRLMFRKEN
jgi:signal transduction histidine kinase